MRRTDTIVKHYFGIKYLGYHTTESLLAEFGLRSRYRTKKVANFRVFILKIINFKYITKIVIFVESFFESEDTNYQSDSEVKWTLSLKV